MFSRLFEPCCKPKGSGLEELIVDPSKLPKSPQKKQSVFREASAALTEYETTLDDYGPVITTNAWHRMLG